MRVAIIPAKGKSKRLPRKNALDIGGRPMLTYPIRAALQSGLFDIVAVSTEDAEIAAIAKEEGATVYPRPAFLSAPNCTVAQVCRNVLMVMREVQKIIPDLMCCLYATAVFVEPEDLQESSELLEKTDFVMGVSEFPYSVPHGLIEDKGYLRPEDSKNFKYKGGWYPRRLSSNGTIYWVRVKAFEAVKDFYGPRLVGYEMPLSKGLDINTEDDYKLACKLMNSGLAPNLPTE